MNFFRNTVICCLLVLMHVTFMGCTPSGDGGFDFMEGTWTTVKDGLSLTVEVTRDPGTGGWLEIQRVDDGNTATHSASIEYNPSSGTWTRTLTLPDGASSTFRGTVGEDGRVVLEQVQRTPTDKQRG